MLMLYQVSIKMQKCGMTFFVFINPSPYGDSPYDRGRVLFLGEMPVGAVGFYSRA